MSGPDDLVPLNNLVGPADESQQPGFDVVFGRGYDRRQVEDYVERVEIALGEADARHAEDVSRLQTGEQQFLELREQLAEAEARAAGLPESATRIGQRLAQMLALAEQEAAEIRARAQAEAHALVQQARQQMDAEAAARTAALEQRERDIAGAGEQADRLRLEAQQDAETVRTAAQRDAEGMLEHTRRETLQQRQQAEHDVQAIHDGARAEAASMTQEARRQVQELSRQRDAIAVQLQSLRDTLSGAVGPLAAAPAADPVTEQLPHQQPDAAPSRGGSTQL